MSLLEEFKNMNRMPIFEIEIDGEYHLYHIQATNKWLELGGVSNVGFMPYNLEKIEWEEGYSLDYHLEWLYEVAYNDAMEQSQIDDSEPTYEYDECRNCTIN